MATPPSPALACAAFLFVLLARRPPRSPLFPYTTLFRSSRATARPSDSARSGVRSSFASPRTPSVPKKRSEEHTSELQSLRHLVCRLLLEKKKKQYERSSQDTQVKDIHETTDGCAHDALK